MRAHTHPYNHTYTHTRHWGHADTKTVNENTETQVKDFSSLVYLSPSLAPLPFPRLFQSPSPAPLSPWQHWHHSEVDTPTVVVLIQWWVTDTHLRTSLWKLHLRTRAAIGQNTKWIGAVAARQQTQGSNTHICGSYRSNQREIFDVNTPERLFFLTACLSVSSRTCHAN